MNSEKSFCGSTSYGNFLDHTMKKISKRSTTWAKFMKRSSGNPEVFKD